MTSKRKHALQTSLTAAALATHEGKWKAATERADQAADYAKALDDWSTVAIQAIAAYHKDKPAERLDSWVNQLVGIGTGRDRATATRFVNDCLLTYSVLDALYHNDDMAARIADAVPEQMFREGYELHEEEDGGDLADELESKLEELETDEAFESSAIWGRVYGGGPLIVGVDDGQDDEMPVNEAAIEAVRYLTPLDRYSLFPVAWYENRKDPKYGRPSVYQILVQGNAGQGVLEAKQKIHESRIIMFPGARTSVRRKRYNWGWDDSIFQRIYQVLMKFGLDWASATHLLSDASQSVLKMKGLIDAIAGNNEAEIGKRGELFDLHRSSLRTVLLDAEEDEEYSRVETSFTGVPEMLDRTTQRLAAAARMPVTVLMGIAPAGLNATGDSDIRNWYDQIRSMQRRQIKPRLQRLLKLIMLSKEFNAGEKEIEVCFRPLWQLSPLEEADRRLKVAQADSIEIERGMATAEEKATSRWGARGYSPETKIDLDLRDDLVEDDAAKAQLGAGKAKAEGEAAKTAAEGATTEEPIVPADDPNAAAKDPNTGLNGAQVTAMLEIVTAVAEEQLPRESAIAMIVASFPVSPERAEEILGKVGKGFKPKKEDPPPLPGGFGKPALGAKPGAPKPPAPAKPPAAK